MTDQTHTGECTVCHNERPEAEIRGPEAGIYEGMCDACANAQAERSTGKAEAQATLAPKPRPRKHPEAERASEPQPDTGGG